MNRVVLGCVAVLIALIAIPVLTADDDDDNFRFVFALIGDNPYTPTTGAVPNKRQAYPPPEYLNLIADINAAKIEFVAHIGDIKAGDTWCSDDVYTNNLSLFNKFSDPVIFMPGDNEWTDCHRLNNGAFSPTERLAFLRNIFYPTSRSLGVRTIRLLRQSDDPKYALYRENVMWSVGPALFVGLNMPGSNNNLGRVPGPEGDDEYLSRNAANMAWLEKASAVAASSPAIKGVMILAQANPFERFLETPTLPASGFADFISSLRTLTLALGKPVVYVHGDTHYFRIDKPLTALYPAPGVVIPAGSRVLNFTRVEVFAQNDVHWIKVRVDARDPNLFEFEQRIVPANGGLALAGKR